MLWACSKSIFMSVRDLRERCHGQPARIAGLVVGLQRPGSASGATFLTLEDEFGMVNVVASRILAERQRRELVASQLLHADGTIETRDGVLHVEVGGLQDISELLQGLDTRSSDFH